MFSEASISFILKRMTSKHQRYRHWFKLHKCPPSHWPLLLSFKFKIKPFVKCMVLHQSVPDTLIVFQELHGQKSLEGCSPWSRRELNTICLENPMYGGAWWAAVHGVVKSRAQLSDFPFTFHFHALEKEMAIHSSVLAWRIPGTGEPGGLPSMGSHRVGHDWSDLAAAAAKDYGTGREI